jgi:hypothetical protein
MEMWLTSSRRFVTFVHTFQNKIRKKIRTAQDQGSRLDLHLELETAYLLLQERSLSVVYEPEMSKRIRGPDFAVSFWINPQAKHPLPGKVHTAFYRSHIS